ncbi:DNA polymerase III subunit beta [Fodinicurvata sp. EGI_FJ10296]|uniref:DNA polymerase III subunit beta n=1 Tax=Fodinicurvata sp. EGI_FJ10296 TaxID=3231908 RepID=UPI0034516430
MKLTIERATLLKSLGHVQSVVERRNTIPILSNVLLRAAGGSLSLTATDMDIEIVDTVDADISVEGQVTAPAHTFHDIVRKLPDGAQVEIDATGETLAVVAGRSRFKLGTLPVEDFPEIGGGELPFRFTVPGTDLREMIEQTRFAVSTEETRYYLNGLYFHAADGDHGRVLRSVATDGHRLARAEIAEPSGAEQMPGVIVPRKTVNEVHRLIADMPGDVVVSLSDAKIRFSFSTAVLTSKLIDGTFPDYARVIPTGNDKTIVLDAKVFASAVDRVSTISSEKSRAVKLAFSSGVMTLSATAADAGSAVEELEIDYDGETFQIGFNSRYLMDIAAQLGDGHIQFEMSDSGSPTIIRARSAEGEVGATLYVLMPMRV